MINIPDLSVIKCSCSDDDYSIDKYECLTCLESLNLECECYLDPDIKQILVFCHMCNDVQEIRCDELCPVELQINTSEVFTDEWPQFKEIQCCIHYNNEIELADGTMVYASTEHVREPLDDPPDFGLYLDEMWKPACLAYLVAWDDYGLPRYWDTTSSAIIDCYNKARNGLWVEIGCLGGHGRTGVVLACMQVLAGMHPKDAVTHIRENYCSKAIETTEQEWWVEWFNVYVNGGKIKKPKHYPDDTLAGQTWTFDGSMKIEVFDPFANPLGKPLEEPTIEYYTRKVRIA